VFTAIQAPVIPEAAAANPDGEALFREARRRGRRRRFLWLGAFVTAVAAALGSYLAATRSVPKAHSESLLSRPLHFPSLSPGESCPATAGRPIHTFFSGVALGNGPARVLVANSGNLLRGRARLGTSEAPGWFALQTIWFSMPGYDGPFVVRAKRLGARSPIEVQPGPTGLAPGSGPLVVQAGPTANTEDGYRTVPGSTWVTSPGCYAWQVDTRNSSEVIVIDALPH